MFKHIERIIEIIFLLKSLYHLLRIIQWLLNTISQFVQDDPDQPVFLELVNSQGGEVRSLAKLLSFLNGLEGDSGSSIHIYSTGRDAISAAGTLLLSASDDPNTTMILHPMTAG